MILSCVEFVQPTLCVIRRKSLWNHFSETEKKEKFEFKMTVLLVGPSFNQIIRVEKRHVVLTNWETYWGNKWGKNSCHDVVNLNSALPFNKRWLSGFLFILFDCLRTQSRWRVEREAESRAEKPTRRRHWATPVYHESRSTTATPRPY